MRPRYAESTDVPVDRTISQLKQLIERFGADQFALMTSAASAKIGFQYKTRMVRFDLALPALNEARFAQTPTGRPRRNEDARTIAWEKECRSQWRALFLLIKALFVAIESGLIDFDRAFMHDIVTPDGKTVGQRLLPEIQRVCDSQSMRGSNLLLGNSDG